MAQKIISIPGASRTFTALSDLGYDLNSAVADILDNSITQGKANIIKILFLPDQNKEFSIVILDDGIGMNQVDLEKAMRIGSENDEYEEGNLSKYGFGLKTASLSQCNHLTVLSKRNSYSETAYLWDMDHVRASNKWELLKLDNNEIHEVKSTLHLKDPFTEYRDEIHKIITSERYTAVLWSDLSVFQKNYDYYKSSVSAENFYHKTCDSLQTYLRLIFHRFLSGENELKKVDIFLNGVKLEALDPFCRNEPHTKEMKLRDVDENFKISNSLPPVTIKRYVLPTNPHKPGEFKFSSRDIWDESRGVLSWNDAQGYYIYRNNRLINFGGWYRTKAKDEHDKLARASIDISEHHDDLFTLDVKKTRIQLPEILKNHLKDNVNKGFISEAKRRYNGSEKKKELIVNTVRSNVRKVSHLSSHLITQDSIKVHSEKNVIKITNPSGEKISNDLTYKMLEAGQKIISKPFGDDKLLWKMVPNPNNEFQVLINSDHPFYEKVYGDAEKDKKITAIMDAFLFTMSFIELKCITTSNEFLFEQISEVASSVLGKFVDEKIL